MKITQEDFPRSDLSGGVRTLDNKKRSTLSKLQNRKSNPSIDNGFNGTSHTSNQPECLKLPTLQTINPGSLLLGSVALVTSSGLRIQTLNNIVGFAKYSDLYDEVQPKVESPDSSFTVPFAVGSNVVCYVLEVYHSYLGLSLKPSLVNSNLRVDTLFPGLLLPSTVLSHEDHGLKVTFNATLKSSIKGFIMYDDSSRENVKEDLIRRYPLSSTAYVVVSSVNLDRGLIKCKWPWVSKAPLDLHTPVVFDALKPGVLVTGEVLNVHRMKCENSTKAPFGGYTIKCLGSLTASLSPLHGLESFGSPEDDGYDHSSYLDRYREVEDQLEARLIFVDFDEKVLHLSMQSQLMRWRGPSGQAHKNLKCSVISCKVTNTFASGLVLKPVEGDAKFLFCSVNDVVDDKDLKPSVVLASRKYAPGTVHECRVLDFNYFTRLTHVAIKSSMIAEKYVSPLELGPSDVVRGKIVKLVNSGAIVQISTLVDGKVPLGHLTQVPGTKLPEGIKIGRNMNLRVLKFDHTRNRLVLTAKNELVNDPNPLVKFDQLHLGKQLLGYIINTKDKNYTQESKKEKVIVKFYDDLQTVLDKDELKKAEENSLELKTDTVVKCAVTRLDQKRRLFSVTIDEDRIEKTIKRAESKRELNKKKRKLACKEAFSNYKSRRKMKNGKD